MRPEKHLAANPQPPEQTFRQTTVHNSERERREERGGAAAVGAGLHAAHGDLDVSGEAQARGGSGHLGGEQPERDSQALQGPGERSRRQGVLENPARDREEQNPEVCLQSRLVRLCAGRLLAPRLVLRRLLLHSSLHECGNGPIVH